MGNSAYDNFKQIKEGHGNGIVYCKAQMMGWRRDMEDTSIHQTDLPNHNSLFGVFDGHGGREVSQYAAENFIPLLTSLQSYKNKQYITALDQSFRMMDERLASAQVGEYLNSLRRYPQPEPVTNYTGSTSLIVLITPKSYIVANAGDSRSVLCRAGLALDLSIEHKPDNEQQQTRIKKGGGEITWGRINGGLNVSRAFGDFSYKGNHNAGYSQQIITCKPDIRVFGRYPEDEFMLIGSDGIWENYLDNSQGLVDIVKQKIKRLKSDSLVLTELLDQLLPRDTISGLGCDNMTAILVKFK